MQYVREAQTSHDLVMQALVWIRMNWFGAVQFGASYAILKQPHIFKCQI
jgi:hypothetical protein